MATINDETIEKLPTLFLWLWVLFLIRAGYVVALNAMTLDMNDPLATPELGVHCLDTVLYITYTIVFFYSWEHYSDITSNIMILRISSYIAALLSIIKMATTIYYRFVYTTPIDLTITLYYLVEIATWLALAVFFVFYGNRFKQKAPTKIDN